MQEGHQFGPPQIRGGPIGLSLYDSMLAFQVHLHSGILEGGDLLLKLVWSDLLFLHLLLHVDKHLKNLAFVQCRWLDVGSYPLR